MIAGKKNSVTELKSMKNQSHSLSTKAMDCFYPLFVKIKDTTLALGRNYQDTVSQRISKRFLKR
jgi:hypothetical protein